jgi:Ribbon-helix-helix protein, copG family
MRGTRKREECDNLLEWYHGWYRHNMAMTLRLDEQETEALRRRAELEGRSMQDLARQAVRDYIERNSKRELLDQVLDEELPRYAEALERLGQ